MKNSKFNYTVVGGLEFFNIEKPKMSTEERSKKHKAIYAKTWRDPKTADMTLSGLYKSDKEKVSRLNGVKIVKVHVSKAGTIQAEIARNSKTYVRTYKLSNFTGCLHKGKDLVESFLNGSIVEHGVLLEWYERNKMNIAVGQI